MAKLKQNCHSTGFYYLKSITTILGVVVDLIERECVCERERERVREN